MMHIVYVFLIENKEELNSLAVLHDSFGVLLTDVKEFDYDARKALINMFEVVKVNENLTISQKLLM